MSANDKPSAPNATAGFAQAQVQGAAIRPASPVALAIAGSDCSGGAGIQADLKTFTALGIYGASVITALTAQNTCGVTAVRQVAPDFIAQQFHTISSDLNIAAIKTGMLGSADIVEAVVECLRADFSPPSVQRAAEYAYPDNSAAPVCLPINVPLIVDPVLVATSGDLLCDPSAFHAIKTKLLPLARLITPNIPEAAVLLGIAPAATISQMEDQARRLLDLGAQAVLLKGGHSGHSGDVGHNEHSGHGRDGGVSDKAGRVADPKVPRVAVDILCTPAQMVKFERPWVETTNTHGTGCTLSAAICAYLIKGLTLAGAVAAAKDYVWGALDKGRDLHIGQGNGPLHHMHEISD